MAAILDMVADRLPDEAALFAASVPRFIEEALGLIQSLPDFTGKTEEQLTIAQKSLVADMAAKSLITPAMSKYKKSLEEAEGDGAGKAKFADKLKFLQEMKSTLETSITEKRRLLNIVDASAPMVVVG
jgi:hypothetical protein